MQVLHNLDTLGLKRSITEQLLLLLSLAPQVVRMVGA
jgi:hypothetical protein